MVSTIRTQAGNGRNILYVAGKKEVNRFEYWEKEERSE